MVSVLVAMDAPVEEPPWVLVRVLSCAFSADWAWMVAASGEVLVPVLVALLPKALLSMALLLAAVELIDAVPPGAAAVAAAVAAIATVPDTALVDWVPLTAPAEVLT